MIKNFLKYITEQVHDDIDPYGEENWKDDGSFYSWINLIRNVDEIDIEEIFDQDLQFIIFWYKKTGSRFELDYINNNVTLFYYLDPNAEGESYINSKVDGIKIENCTKEELLLKMRELILKNAGDVWKEYL